MRDMRKPSPASLGERLPRFKLDRLILADLQTIENALPKLEKDLRGKKIEPAYMEAVKQAKTILEAGETIDKAAREGRPWAPGKRVAACECRQRKR